MCGVMLLSMASPWSAAQSLCADMSMFERQYADLIIDDGRLHADAGEVDLQAYGESRLSGSVRLRYQREVLLADDVRYTQADRHLRVDGQTIFETDEVQVRAGSADIHMDEERARFGDARYTAFAARARGVAGELSLSGAGEAELRDVRYTSCAPEAEDWVLLADEIRLDSARGMGSARNARLRFKGVPLFWLPVFYFPVGDQRQTGLLPMSVGDSSNAGLDISVPLYINLAPNYDLTLTARYMAERGEQARAELRYLWSHSEGRSVLEYLPEDDRLGSRRLLAASTLRGGLSQGWNWQAQWLRVTDNAYLSDLGSAEADPSQSQLPRNARIDFRQHGFHAALAAQGYQSLIPSGQPGAENYTRLPELQLGWQGAYRHAVPRPSVQLSTVNFRHPSATEAVRNDALMALDWRYDIPQAFATAHLDYRATDYRLRAPGLAVTDLDRGLPTLQTGLGLRFIRYGRDGNQQTLTPRINYLYVPYRDQDEIPIFDTSQPDFSFDQLFALNRFTGLDRIADANLITTAVRTDWYAEHGLTRLLTAKLGVQWQLEDTRVSLPNQPALGSGSSDWLGELDFQFNKRWRGQMFGQWNAEDNRIDQGSVATRYDFSDRGFAQLSYRFRRDSFEQTDLLMSVPVRHNWRVAGRWTYSLEDQRSLEAMGGFEYRSCCWATQVAWRRFLSSADGQFNSSIYLQLELNGLGRIGEALDSLLDRDIL